MTTATTAAVSQTDIQLREILSRLTWDVEDDLARLIGDIPAERLTYHARSLAAWRFKAQAQIGQAITGYLRDPTSGLPARSEFHASQEEIRLIESEIDQLEVRIRALSGQ